jgi:GntR family transcriptional regulator / MocR family aminotransferase
VPVSVQNMGTTSPDLYLAVDRGRGVRAQVEAGIRAAVRGGRLAAGTRLPSTRALAADLGVTRRLVVEAYDQLAAEGYVSARQGAGTVVNAVPRGTGAAPSAEAGRRLVVDFRPGHPDPALFPRAAWARASRAVCAGLGAAELDGGDRRGLPGLRTALAEYLGRVRGVDAHPDRIVVCSSFGHAVDLLVRVLPGHRFAVEEPGYPVPRNRLLRDGRRVDPVAVDGEGLIVDALRRTTARAVVVTPAHQSPTGVAMSPARRNALVTWARDVDGYVVEDDFDAEFRYDRRPVGALQGLAPERVVYCGTTAKTLATGLRLGWAVLPAALVDEVVALRADTDGATSAILQATFAQLLRSGDLDRHLRRSRRVYRVRRDAVVAAVRRWLPQATVGGIAAGLNVVLTLPDGTDEQAVVARAAERGVGVYPHRWFTADPGCARPGLVLGYGTVSPEQAEQGVRVLGEVVAAR